MESFIIEGGHRLSGTITPQGAKNEALEVICATLLTEDEVVDFCMDLPRYKRPRKIIFAEVPRNPTGKIEKPKLRKQFCGGSLVEAQIK